ncbi:MAG: hypothetical protein R3292_08625 [Alcanivorax sp.]|nr:hypothetical protein [Alcanivorax sp.]
MKYKTPFVAFVAPEPLQHAIVTFLEAVRVRPDADHGALLQAIAPLFIEVALDTFFLAPLRLSSSQGASPIPGSIKMIRKAALSMSGKVVKGANQNEQMALADHFQSLCLWQDGQLHIVFPLLPAVAENIAQVLGLALTGQACTVSLMDAMHAVHDEVLATFYDATTDCLSLGRVNRHLTAAARVTIRKAASSAMDKSLLAMDPEGKKALARYFHNLLKPFDYEQSHGSKRRQPA